MDLGDRKPTLAYLNECLLSKNEKWALATDPSMSEIIRNEINGSVLDSCFSCFDCESQLARLVERHLPVRP